MSLLCVGMEFLFPSNILVWGLTTLFAFSRVIPVLSDCNNDVGKNEAVPCGGPDSFVNLCGICVGGQTGRLNTEGLDGCSVCGGGDSCIGCDEVTGSTKTSDNCGACLEPDESSRDNCIKITSVFPSILDKAVDKVVTVKLRGAGLNPTNLPDVSCSLQPQDSQQQPAKIEKQSVEDGVIQLEVSLADKSGVYAIHCSSNTIGPIDSGDQVTLSIVDSKELCVKELKPEKVSVDKEFQMELTIPSVKENASVMCFIKREGQETAEVLPATKVTAGYVKCGPYVAKRASRMEWGAAYSWDAAADGESCGSAAKLTATAPPPVMESAKFSDGLHELHISFDHNVDGSEKCEEIFTPDTVAFFGKGANCSFVANNLIVTLGTDPKLKEDSELKLLDNSKVYREQSDPSLTQPATGKVTLTPPDAKASEPRYDVIVPKLICPDPEQGRALGMNVPVSNGSSSDHPPQVIRMSTIGAQKLNFNWTVEFEAEGKGQRHNLMIWRSIRMLQRELKKCQIMQCALNTSMLMPGIKYKISVTGKNAMGKEGEKKQFEFNVMPKDNKNGTSNISKSSSLVLKGPSSTWSKANYYAEAEVDSCEASVMKPTVTCEWKIDGELTKKMDLPQGKRLFLPAGILQGGKEYIISSTCTAESKETSEKTEMKASLAVTVQPLGIEAQISRKGVVLGTGQDLQLDASLSQDLDKKPGNLQFNWCCRQQSGQRCLLPRAGETITLENAYKDAFQRPVLKIPAGSLPVGRYVFTVEVSKAGSPTTKEQANVEVIPGTPAIVNTPSAGTLQYVNPKEGVTVPAVVLNTREGCRMWWSVLQEPGHEYFNLAEVVGLGDAVLVTLEESKDDMGREFPLVIPGPTGSWPGLKDNADYKLRLSVFCPQQGKQKQTLSYADYIVSTNSPPKIKPLKVNPSNGEGLRTKFTFSTEVAEDSPNDYPLLYKFGYRIGDQKETHIFSTSNMDLHATTILPCVSGEETIIIPVLTVCDVHHICTTVTGDPVTTTLPKDLTLAEVQEIGAQFSEYMSTQQYTEGQSLAQMSLQTLKQLPNQELYTAASENFETEIRNELKRKQDGLETNSVSLQSSLDFLDMSINVLRELPMSGSTLQDLSAFKDKILSLTKYNNEIRVKYTAFPDRHSNSPKLNSRQRRGTGTANNQNNKQDSTTIYSESNVKSLLQVTEILLKSANESVVLKEKKKLVGELRKYMYHLCLGKDQRIYIKSKVVQFSVQKLLSPDHILKTEFHVPDRVKEPPAINETAMVKLGKFVADKYGPSRVSCLGGVHFPGDYNMDVAIAEKTVQNKDVTRASSVFEAWLVKIDKLPGKLDSPITVKVPIDSTKMSTGQMLKCAMWMENSWIADACVTEELTRFHSIEYAVCKCDYMGYYTVIVLDIPTTTTTTTTIITTTPKAPPPTTLTTTPIIPSTVSSTSSPPPTTSSTVPTTSIETTTIRPTTEETTQSSTRVPDTITAKIIEEEPCKDFPTIAIIPGMPISNVTYNVSFRIEEDFNSVVGERKEEFEQKLRCEILAHVKMPVKMIQQINVSPGSIIVTVRLVDTDVKAAKEVIPEITEALQKGDLELKGLDNKKLNTPRQTITIVEPYKPGKSNAVVYVVVGCVVISTISIVSLIAGAVIIKRKKDAEKLKKQQLPNASNGVPTYRQFQFEHSIEGTEASLARYRSTYPTMGTAGTLMMGTAKGMGGSQVVAFTNRAGVRYEPGTNGNQYLHPDMSYNASQTSKKTKKKKPKTGVHRKGSKGGLLNNEETSQGDQDSGIVDGCTNSMDDRNLRNRNRDKKSSVTEFDGLPGTPTDNM